MDLYTFSGGWAYIDFDTLLAAVSGIYIFCTRLANIYTLLGVAGGT